MIERFGDQLRRALSARSVTQKALAGMIGVSDSYVGDVIKGTRDPFTPERVEATIRALDLSRDDGDALSVAAAAERLVAYTPKQMLTIVVDKLGKAKTLQLVEQVCAERKRGRRVSS